MYVKYELSAQEYDYVKYELSAQEYNYVYLFYVLKDRITFFFLDLFLLHLGRAKLCECQGKAR